MYVCLHVQQPGLSESVCGWVEEGMRRLGLLQQPALRARSERSHPLVLRLGSFSQQRGPDLVLHVQEALEEQPLVLVALQWMQGGQGFLRLHRVGQGGSCGLLNKGGGIYKEQVYSTIHLSAGDLTYLCLRGLLRSRGCFNDQNGRAVCDEVG